MSAKERETSLVFWEAFGKWLGPNQPAPAGDLGEAFLRHLKPSEMLESFYHPTFAKSIMQILGDPAIVEQHVPFEQVPVEPSDTFALPSSPLRERTPLSTEDQLETLREQGDDLRVRNERLRSLVAQERRLATRETQRNDRLLSQLEVQERSLQRMAETLSDMAKANDSLQRALIADKEGQLRMFESHEGVVMHLDDESVVVTYSIDGDYIDQTYKKDQFIGARLPEKGDRLAVFVHVAGLPKQRPDKETSARSPDDQRRYRKHAVRPPREF
jgi:hypothetical protein